MSTSKRVVRIALDVPIADAFDYETTPEFAEGLAPGDWVLVPWGTVQRVGVVLGFPADSEVDPARLKPIAGRLPDAPPADALWLKLARFAADYYHRPIGEVLLPAIPKLLRSPPKAGSRGSPFARARKKGAPFADAVADSPLPLNPEQQAALAALDAAQGFATFLLHGITGSGKTEVYLQWLAHRLAAAPDAQVLMLVPEIGLTPQLGERLARRFAGLTMAVLHSDLPDGERATHWLAAAEGRARVVIGTRLAVLAPLPKLAAIVVDEEHDASYKQQEGVRYSARDLAVALAAQRGIPVVLGSATPAVETWAAARRGRYALLSMPTRAAGGAVPALRILNLRGAKTTHGLMDASVTAIRDAVARGQQALVFMNRRGFAPVLTCEACGWLSKCDTCSAFRVLHRLTPAPGAGGRPTDAAQGVAAAPRPGRYRLVCHHCSADRPVPRSCPDCGNVDLTPLGRGTQRLEETLAEVFPGARIARLDRDVARRRGAAEEVLAAAHAGTLDILVGTQMLAKGHDFERLSVVVIVDPDGGLYSSDFRAPERLFATLMQVAGRAGRSAASGGQAQVIVQTRFPDHPLFGSLVRHDYAGFAARQLEEREQAGLPPFVHQALLRAESRELAAALNWLGWAREQARELIAQGPADGVALFDPVPMAMVRVANTDRAQLLVESASRKALHALLDAWLPALREGKPPAGGPPVRWQLEVDPLEI